MYKNIFIALFFFFIALSLSPSTALAAEDARSIELPAADKSGGMPLMQALAERKSTRKLNNEALSAQELSNILWAAWGINREDGKRTIPTARNQQKVSLYLAHMGAIWIYDAQNHAIHKILDEDVSAKFDDAALTLFFAAEEGKYSNMHVGSMYQNVGLYCASAKLGNVVRAKGVDFLQEKIAPYLPSNFTIRITQSIGKMQ